MSALELDRSLLMKTPFSTAATVLAPLVVLFSLSCTPPAEELSQARRDAIRDSVRTFLDSWEARVEALEMEETAELYSGDEAFRWLEDGRIRYRSQAEVLESLRGVEGGLSESDFRWESLEIVPVGPGAAVVTGRFHQAFEYQGGGGFEFSGVLSAVLRHEAGGWRFLVGHSSSAAEEPGGGG